MSKDAEDWERRERLNKSEAERLLDWLEANGCPQREVSIAEDGSFTVRWRNPRGIAGDKPGASAAG